MAISTSSEKGFTLVELMVAMLISLVSMFALLNALMAAREVNLKNLLRDEAVQIASDRMMQFRARPFGQISSASPAPYVYPTDYVSCSLRGATNAPPYRVVRSAVSLSPTSKLVDVRVRWIFKNTSTSHEVQSVVQQ